MIDWDYERSRCWFPSRSPLVGEPRKDEAGMDTSASESVGLRAENKTEPRLGDSGMHETRELSDQLAAMQRRAEAAESDWQALEQVNTALRGQFGWRPIDTAPKDGTAIVVLFRGEPHVARYSPLWSDDNLRWLVRQPSFSDDRTRLVSEISPNEMQIQLGYQGPTHWMPLPDVSSLLDRSGEQTPK